MNGEFFSFHVGVGDVIAAIAMAVVYSSFRLENKKAGREREKIIGEQVKMHTENRNDLANLLTFQKLQMDVNAKRDEQVKQLSIQTATITEIARGLNRRLELVENLIGRKRRAGEEE